MYTTAKYVQNRSSETKEAFLDATLALLEEKDFSEIAIKEIADRAGRAVGSFYNHFESAQDILSELYERYVAERGSMEQGFLAPERWETLSLEGAVARLVSLTLAEYEGRSGLFRAFRAHRELYQPGEEDAMGLMYDGVGNILASKAANLKDPAQSAQFAFFVVTSVGQAALVDRSRHAAFLNISRAELQRGLVNMILTYLEAQSS